LNIIYIFGIALALSIDAFAVSVINGVTVKNLKFRQALVIALFFGGFQAIMPIIGWSIGPFFKGYIENISHWIAFILLVIVGAKMIYESIFRKEKNNQQTSKLGITTLLILSIATSIDAFAVGLSFSLVGINIFLPAIIIGFVTFFVCLIGVYIGDRASDLCEKKLGAAGGIVLILIGVKILIPGIV